MYYIEKNIGYKTYEINDNLKIDLPLHIPVPCELVGMRFDKHTSCEVYEVSLVGKNDKTIFVNKLYSSLKEIISACDYSNMRMLIVQTLGNREIFNELKIKYEEDLKKYYDIKENSYKIKSLKK